MNLPADRQVSLKNTNFDILKLLRLFAMLGLWLKISKSESLVVIEISSRHTFLKKEKKNRHEHRIDNPQ